MLQVENSTEVGGGQICPQTVAHCKGRVTYLNAKAAMYVKQALYEAALTRDQSINDTTLPITSNCLLLPLLLPSFLPFTPLVQFYRAL